MKPLCWLHAAIFSAGLLLTGPAALAQDTPAPAASAATDNADSIAVVIGNGTYQGGTMPAPYAENDADAMQDWLVHGLGFTPDNIILEKNATLDTFNRIFGTADHPEAGELSSRVRPSRSNVFVFYSGHGAPDVSDKTAGDKPAYLIPVDVAPAEAKNGYSEETLMRNLEAVRQQIGRDHWLVAMLETSFSGETPRGSLLGPSERLSFTPKAYDPKASVIKVLAARNNQVANWDEKAKLGLMTSRFLLAAAGEGGQTPEGMVPWSGIATYVTGEVTRLSRTENAHGQDAAIDPAPIAAKPYVVPQIAPELGGIRDQAAWDAAQKADTRQAYADYAAQCAGIVTAPCAFKSQAEARIGQIEHAAAVAQDQTLWDAAQKADTRQAYADYLAQCATVATAPCAYRARRRRAARRSRMPSRLPRTRSFGTRSSSARTMAPIWPNARGRRPAACTRPRSRLRQAVRHRRQCRNNRGLRHVPESLPEGPLRRHGRRDTSEAAAEADSDAVVQEVKARRLRPAEGSAEPALLPRHRALSGPGVVSGCRLSGRTRCRTGRTPPRAPAGR